MSLKGLISPLHQLEQLGIVPDSGVIDRMAAQQPIAVPHWVEIRDGCLIGRYTSDISVPEAIAKLRSLEPELSSDEAEELAMLRQLAADDPNFQRRYNTVDEKVAAELVARDMDDVVLMAVGPEILTRFLALHSGGARAIQTFAGRFGMLHTLSDSDSANSLTETSLWRRHHDALPSHIREEEVENGVDVFESLAYWQDFSRFAFLALRLAANLDDPHPEDQAFISVEEWQFFERFLNLPRKKSSKSTSSTMAGATKADAAHDRFQSTDTVTNLRLRFSRVLNELQDVADVKLELRWGKPKPVLEFRVIGLVSVIASQLLMAAAQRENFVQCTHCPTVFRPWHQPQTGKVNLYCAECRGNQVPQRDATKRYRDARRRQARAGRKGNQ